MKLIEKICFNKLKLTRLEILTETKNKASQKVAVKSGYKKEGVLRKALIGKDKNKKDAALYAKVKK